MKNISLQLRITALSFGIALSGLVTIAAFFGTLQIVKNEDGASRAASRTLSLLQRAALSTEELSTQFNSAIIDPSVLESKKFLSPVERSINHATEAEESTSSAEIKSGMQSLKKLFEIDMQKNVENFKALAKSDPAGMRKYYKDEFLPLREKIIDQLDSAGAISQEIYNKAEEQKAKYTRLSSYSMVAIVLFFLVLVLWYSFFLSKSLTKSLAEIGKDLDQSTTSIQQASTHLTSTSAEVSNGASSSATSLTEIVASLNIVSEIVSSNAKSAKSAAVLSQDGRTAAEKGNTEILNLIKSMSEIAESSTRITEIINVIDDIAFQINLLALNASIEAARAGEHGKGFAVVADAVQSLAQRSAVAAKDISLLIKETALKTQKGAEIADQSGIVLNDIVVITVKVADLNNEIAISSDEQSHGITQINFLLKELDSVTQKNANAALATLQSSQVLAEQSNSLSSNVTRLWQLQYGMKKRKT